MNARKIRESLQKIADNNGVSVEEVRRDIADAIDAARENPDPKVQAFWASVPRKGEKPTPEEVIAYIGGIVGGKMKGG